MFAEDGDGEQPGGPAPEATPETAAAAGWREGKSLREIAVDLFGAERVAAEWHSDSCMRAWMRRLLHRVRRAERLSRPPVREDAASAAAKRYPDNADDAGAAGRPRGGETR